VLMDAPAYQRSAAAASRAAAPLEADRDVHAEILRHFEQIVQKGQLVI